MNLRFKTLIIVGASLICLIIILYATAQMELRNSFSKLEEQDTQNNVLRVQNAINSELASLGDLADYWAARNDTYDFIKTGNIYFIDYNIASGSLTNESLNNTGVNLILFMDSIGQIAFGRYLNASGKAEDIPQGFIDQLSLYGFCPGCFDKQSKFSGIIMLSNMSMLIVTQPITGSKRYGPPSGRVILGRYLTDNEVGKISETVQMSLAIYPIQSNRMPADFRQVKSLISDDVPILVRPLDQGTIAGYTLLKDIYGKPLLILRVDTPRDIFRQGTASMQNFIIIFSVAGLIFLILTLVYLDRSILSHLSNLTAGITRISKSQNMSFRIKEQGKDELSNLANSINSMLSALEEAHKEQRTSEKRYRAVVEEQPDLICRNLVDGTITFTNDAFCDFFSMHLEEIRGGDMDQLAEEGHLKPPLELKSILSPDSPTFTYECQSILPSGTHWLQWTSHGIFDESGNLVEIQSVGRDITELKMMQEALMQSERRLADIIDFLPEALLAIDLEGKVIVWNKAMELLTGFKAEEMLGKGNYEHSLPFYRIRRPILVDMVLTPYKDIEREYFNIQKDGTTVLGETFIPTFGQGGSYLLGKATALWDASGQIVGAIESIRDMTDRRLMEQKLERSRAELHIAAAIQRRFIPEKIPVIPGFEIAAVSIPAMEVGGDFYDFIPLPEGRYGLVIADVAGKSIPAALFMALSRTIIRANVAHQSRTSDVLKNANNMIASDATAGMFVTLLYGILDGETLSFNYADAGHPPPLLFRAGIEVLVEEPVTGIALGAKEGAIYEESTIKFSPGDVAVFYTDGVTEAMNTKGEMYGQGRIADMVSRSRQMSAEMILRRLQSDISSFSSGREQNDDITMVVLKACRHLEKHSELCVRSIKEAIPLINAFLDDIMSCSGFGKKEISEVQLAVEEAVINIIHHGYRGSEGSIHLKCDFRDGCQKIVIEDSAPPFDPTTYSMPDLASDLELRRIGGLGIHLIKSLTDGLKYEFRDGKNRLIMMKKSQD
ncbi:Methanogenesis regulatory histidine kinase FilI [uncultured archaeon]|nr:Methanogenesis regulatory histidine kinase FilI [uncultured archaeon]